MNRENSTSFETTFRSGERTPQSDGFQPDVSFLIINYNTRDELRRCLQSIVLEVRDVACERIVIDNGSTDDSAGTVRGAIRRGFSRTVATESRRLMQ